MPTTTRNAHYVLSTHWDREWYEPLQHYRYRLVQLIDRVIDGIETGRLQGPFQTDGQAIILKDYLEVRPERRALIERYVRERKFIVGPWYVLPDEFIISGESHIRNLRLGRETVREFGGEPSQAGFVCDLFGHISQMPQIFAGFGIEVGYLWRGVDLLNKRQAIWTGADGTEMVCYRFGDMGYGDYAWKVRAGGKVHEPFDAKELRKRLDEFVQQEIDQSQIDALLLFDGCDHQEWDEPAYKVLLEKKAEGNGLNIIHSNLDDFQKELLAQRDRVVDRIEGELRVTGRVAGRSPHQIHGVLSSRVWIKQQNAQCQNLLCQWAEPMSAFANQLVGLEYPQGFLNVAWEWLIQNHPHDSICGCSVDQVHEDMKFRFAQSRLIAERVTLEATRRITANVSGTIGDDELRITVFNPLPADIDQPVDLTLDIPKDWPMFAEFFGFERKPAFRLYDAEGAEIPYQRNGQTYETLRKRLFDTKFPDGYHVNATDVTLPLRIPAMGYTTIVAKKVEGQPTRHPQDKGLATGINQMSNELVTVYINGNGTISVQDNETGHVSGELLLFEDCADIGDGWFRGSSIQDQAFVSSGAQADIALIENGPYSAAYRIRVTMRVPECFDDKGKRWGRSDKFVDMAIDTIIRLRAGSGMVECETTVNNTARDHRLRVLFSPAVDGFESVESYYTDTPFDVVERRIGVREDNHLYHELEVETQPQQTFITVGDGESGLAIVSTGLMESCVRDLDDRPIALTLLRSTYRTVLTDGEPNGQIPGKHTFRYYIVPFSGEPDFARLSLLGQHLSGGLKTVQLREVDRREYSKGHDLPPTSGYLKVDAPAVMSSARLVGDALEVRVWNPTIETISTSVSTSGKFSKAGFVDFESNAVEGGRLDIKGGKAWFQLGPKKIATVRLEGPLRSCALLLTGTSSG